MDHVSEYNVEGGLIRLGEFIFLELLSEMELPQDVRQFLILNKKTFELILHPRYARIIQSITQIAPVFLIKEAWQGSSDGNKFIHSDEDNYCTIAIDPIIKEGIVRIEVIFKNTGSCRCIGIADASCSFEANKLSKDDGNDKKTICYSGAGQLNQQGWFTNAYQSYFDGQRIAAEVDMTTIPRRLTFFVSDVEQPVQVISIPSAIRFWVRLHNGTFFFIHRYKVRATNQIIFKRCSLVRNT
ncbi:MAG: hypothetical protein EZS28_008161 [Streblomastix strix]|uniref:Uncharacterized protein n=1 Tax=Streblomastix strix TaxID=222440 RepID=A0A5J4WNV2_9EUKA|nr:MAG: hypothetical protein EZS28_008161 [Streblomastix strix]